MKRFFLMTVSLVIFASLAQAAPQTQILLGLDHVVGHMLGKKLFKQRMAQITSRPGISSEKAIYMTAGKGDKEVNVLISAVPMESTFTSEIIIFNIDIVQKLDHAARMKLAKNTNSPLYTGHYAPRATDVRGWVELGEEAQKVLSNLSEVEEIGQRIMTNLRNSKKIEIIENGTEVLLDVLEQTRELRIKEVIAGPRKFPLATVSDFKGEGQSAVYRLQAIIPTNATAEEVKQILQAISEAFY